MKKLFYVFIILLLFGLPSLLDISIYGASPKKSADADHTEQPAPAGKEGNMNPVEATSLEIQKTINSTGAMSNNSTADTDNSAEDATVVSDQDDSITKKMVSLIKTEKQPVSVKANKTKIPDSCQETTKSTDNPETVSSTSTSDPQPAETKEPETKPDTASTEAPVTSKQEKSEKTSSSKTNTAVEQKPVTEPVQEEKTTQAEKPPQDKQSKTVVTNDPIEEATTEAPKCKHSWVWATHTETKIIPAVTHEEPVYNDGWDEAVKVRKILCPCCNTIYEDLADYNNRDLCYGNFGHITVVDHYIHHDPELLYYDTIVDEPEHEETVTVKDYQYCSICGERK